MARCRNLKPGFFTNERLGELPALTRLLFAGLWTEADREGRLEDRPKRLKTRLLPYDTYDVDGGLGELAAGDDPFIHRYEADGKRYIQIRNFLDHQHPHNTEKPSIIPGFPLNNGKVTQTAQPGIGIEVRGKRRKVRGKRSVKIDDVPIPESLATPEVRQAVGDWLAYKAARGEAYRDGAYLGRKVAEFMKAGPAAFVAAVSSSMGSNYAGLFPAKAGRDDDPRGVKSAVTEFLSRGGDNG